MTQHNQSEHDAHHNRHEPTVQQTLPITWVSVRVRSGLVAPIEAELVFLACDHPVSARRPPRYDPG